MRKPIKAINDIAVWCNAGKPNTVGNLRVVAKHIHHAECALWPFRNRVGPSVFAAFSAEAMRLNALGSMLPTPARIAVPMSDADYAKARETKDLHESIAAHGYGELTAEDMETYENALKVAVRACEIFAHHIVGSNNLAWARTALIDHQQTMKRVLGMQERVGKTPALGEPC